MPFKGFVLPTVGSTNPSLYMLEMPVATQTERDAGPTARSSEIWGVQAPSFEELKDGQRGPSAGYRRNGRRGPSHAGQSMRHPWRPSGLTWSIATLVIAGLGIFLYPQAASWFAQYHQSRELEFYSHQVESVVPSAPEQLRAAHTYNDALKTGEITVGSGAHKPTSGGSSGSILDYDKLLAADDSGLMARIKIDAIKLDLPIYHGTSDETLLRGAGHLEGSSLPVGGVSTHSVITAHRGLANATMFTNLDKVVEGDTFVLEVFGEVLTYRVRSKIVVDPEDTETLFAQEGQDLVTLITCTPLGINSHRILVTGERVTPTPINDVVAVGEVPDIPGFPWWLVLAGAGSVGVLVFVWRSGFSDARVRAVRLARKTRTQNS